jgi:hypothetical protein
MTVHYNKLTDIQQANLRDTFFLMPDSELTTLLLDLDARIRFREKIAKGYIRQKSIDILIKFEQERRAVSCSLYDYRERKEKLALISRQSESDIIRAQLRAFGTRLRSQRS